MYQRKKNVDGMYSEALGYDMSPSLASGRHNVFFTLSSNNLIQLQCMFE